MEMIEILKVEKQEHFPPWMTYDTLANFLHENMKPYEDTEEDIKRGLRYALSEGDGKGGFLLLAVKNQDCMGALVILHTGMKGYIPENILLFVGVSPQLRGQGIGTCLIKRAVSESEGAIKLHVEYENPAMRLYEKMGFDTKYAEMRLSL